MGKLRRFLVFIFALLLTLLTFNPANDSRISSPYSFLAKENIEAKDNIEVKDNIDKYAEWIIKWDGQNFDKELISKAEILDWVPEQQVMRVRMTNNKLRYKWLEEVRESPRVVYIQPNYQHSIHQAPNDTYYERQTYLKQIKAEEAWEVVNSTDLTIAVLDTGVDLFHPDLKDNLVEGYNLLDKESQPMDDNGHGTNVAGIVAATANNSDGVTGVAWNTKIMPIKVLEQNGEGRDFFIGQGIRYAVNQGAKVVVLSLGQFDYTPFMKEAIDYAETKGVLIVAATGNDGNLLKFPSAFNNVLSVGAVDRHDLYEPYSNFGQQLDVVAPDEGIYTTKLGGGYTENSGTSMAAPQVAGLAALIFQKYPDMTPQEVRDLIKFTADDVGSLGWDERTGYGRINMERALKSPRQILIDGYESNQYSYTARQFPLGDTFYAQLNPIDTDWFKLSIPYDGTTIVHIHLDQILEHGISLEIYSDEQLPETLTPEFSNLENQENNENRPISYQIRKEEYITLNLPKGNYYLKINLLPEQVESDINLINYQISNSFTIYKDEYEGNDKPWQAYELEKPDIELTGTIDKDNDVDWYKIVSNSNGMLTITTAVDTLRLDPVILFQPPDGKNKVFDYQGAGEEEFGTVMVSKGEYLIRISDYNNFRVDGEYKLKLHFRTSDNDENEPNNASQASVPLDLTDKKIAGIVASPLDADWFKFTVDEKSYLAFDFIAKGETEIVIYNDKLEALKRDISAALTDSYIIDPGKYYLRMSADYTFNNYSFKLISSVLDGNFIDIHYHWARDSILFLFDRNLMSGYDDYTFKPENLLTREEAAVVFSKYFGLTNQGDIAFSDIEDDEINDNAIRATVSAGIMEGFLDGTFRPYGTMSRQEIISVLTKAFHVPRIETPFTPFLDDVTLNNKAYLEIYTFFENRWLEDFIVNNSFSPDKPITRAEFAVLFDRMIRHKEGE